MKSKDLKLVVGLKVVAVHQERVPADKDEGRPGFTNHIELELEGGVFLIPSTVETSCGFEYGCEMQVVKRKKTERV